MPEPDKFRLPLRERLRQAAYVATPEESAGYFEEDDERWGETLQGGDSPTGFPMIYINDAKFQSAGAAEDYREKAALAESLHLLKSVEPERYKRLKTSALGDKGYMDWANRSYEREKRRRGEARDFDKWHDVSRFDQVIGGYLFAQDPAFPSMKEWDRSEPYGGAFKNELEILERDLK